MIIIMIITAESVLSFCPLSSSFLSTYSFDIGICFFFFIFEGVLHFHERDHLSPRAVFLADSEPPKTLVSETSETSELP